MEQSPDDVRESDLCAELGLDASHQAQVRRDHLARQDWYRAGSGRAVWLTPEGQAKLRIFAEVKDDASHLAHHFIEALVIGAHPHPSWVRIRVNDGDGEWVAKDCLVPRRIKRYMLPGKKIRVEVITSINGTAYRHEALAAYS